jgi:hypothetical protein
VNAAAVGSSLILTSETSEAAVKLIVVVDGVAVATGVGLVVLLFLHETSDNTPRTRTAVTTTDKNFFISYLLKFFISLPSSLII